MHDTNHPGQIFGGRRREELEAALPDYVRSRRWFGGKARAIRSISVVEEMPLAHGDETSHITILRVEYEEGGPQHYVLPVSFVEAGSEARNVPPGAVIARLRAGEGMGELLLYDATFNPGFTLGLLDAIREGARFAGPSGEIVAWGTALLEPLVGSAPMLEPSIMGAEQSNTSIRYGNTLILKLFRRLEEGTSPDLEVGRFLGERGFTHTPPLAGALEYRAGSEPVTLAILQGFVPNRGDAWSFTLEMLEEYYPKVAALAEGAVHAPPRGAHTLDLAEAGLPSEALTQVGQYAGWAGLLGRRTAEMHLALASGSGEPPFEPEAYTAGYQREVYTSMRGLAEQALALLDARLADLPAHAADEARTLLSSRSALYGRFEALLEREVGAVRTRCHGDYHLGQVLFTGDDFMVIDFEGEPVRSLGERRQKHSPLKDVAGMLRSFHYAAYSGLFSYLSPAAGAGGQNVAALPGERWADAWQGWVSAAYLREYLETAGPAPFLPHSRADLRTVLDAHLLEKAVYELIYELNNRPAWVMIPLKGLLKLLG